MNDGVTEDVGYRDIAIYKEKFKITVGWWGDWAGDDVGYKDFPRIQKELINDDRRILWQTNQGLSKREYEGLWRKEGGISYGTSLKDILREEG